MTPERVVLAEGAGNVRYIYRMPCGVLTYKKDRKRHNWILLTTGQAPCSFGEEYSAACDAALARGGRLVLELDGVALNARKT